jgi:hypothetical protein
MADVLAMFPAGSYWLNSLLLLAVAACFCCCCCCRQVKELLQANKPVRDAEWTAKEVSACVEAAQPRR